MLTDKQANAAYQKARVALIQTANSSDASEEQIALAEEQLDNLTRNFIDQVIENFEKRTRKFQQFITEMEAVIAEFDPNTAIAGIRRLKEVVDEAALLVQIAVQPAAALPEPTRGSEAAPSAEVRALTPKAGRPAAKPARRAPKGKRPAAAKASKRAAGGAASTKSRKPAAKAAKPPAKKPAAKARPMASKAVGKKIATGKPAAAKSATKPKPVPKKPAAKKPAAKKRATKKPAAAKAASTRASKRRG